MATNATDATDAERGNPWLTLPEVALLCGRPLRTVQRWTASGRLPASQAVTRGRYRVLRESLYEFLEESLVGDGDV